jgi:hypothetical protein
MHTIRTCLTPLFVLLLSLLAEPVPGQDELPRPTAAGDLPAGGEVVRRNVQVLGGKQRHQNIRTTSIKGQITIQPLNVTGQVETYYAAPDKMLSIVDLPGIGETRQGINGAVAWEMSPVSGARLLGRQEATRLLEDLSSRSVAAPESIYAAMSNQGIEQVAGEPCYKVELKRKDGSDAEVTYYSVKSGLARKIQSQRPTPFGKVPVETTLDDYVEVDGIKAPATITSELSGLGMTQHVKIESFRYNQKLDPELFSIPDDVQALLK